MRIVDDMPKDKYIDHMLHFLSTYERLCCQDCWNDVFVITFLLQRSLQIYLGDTHHRFIFVQLRFTESGRNNVVKLQVVFQRWWLNAVLPLSWLFFFMKVLELAFTSIIMISTQLLSISISSWNCANSWLRLSLIKCTECLLRVISQSNHCSLVQRSIANRNYISTLETTCTKNFF